MAAVEMLELHDESRRAWRGDGPRPVRTLLWRPEGSGVDALVVLSHGSGGAAVDLAWLGEALSADGFLVAAVDHHGNSCEELVLPEGAAFWWERPGDLTVVVDHLQRTEAVRSVGVIGYSLGGYTAAAVLGASSNLGAVPAALGFSHGLPGWLACHLLKLSFTPLCAAAVVSSIMWLSVMPNDVEIDKAISAWMSVGTELNAIGELSKVLSLSEDAWDDDARTAFNAWVNNFQTELDSAIAMAAGAEPGDGGNAKALKDCLDASSSFKTSCSVLTSPAWRR